MKKIIITYIMLSLLILVGFGNLLTAGIDRITLRVDGLACPFCAYGLEKKVMKIKDVKSYDVNMKEGKVFVGFKPDASIALESFYNAVKEAGFTLRSINVRVKGKILSSQEGIVLIAEGVREQLLLFEKETVSKKYHKKEISKSMSEDLKKKLLEITKSDRAVIIEGDVHKHEGLYYGLSVDYLEIIE